MKTKSTAARFDRILRIHVQLFSRLRGKSILLNVQLVERPAYQSCMQ